MNTTLIGVFWLIWILIFAHLGYYARQNSQKQNSKKLEKPTKFDKTEVNQSKELEACRT